MAPEVHGYARSRGETSLKFRYCYNSMPHAQLSISKCGLPVGNSRSADAARIRPISIILFGCAPCGGASRMSEQRVERRLAAILAVDVAGYSRLMGEDEEGTRAACVQFDVNWAIPRSPSTAVASSRRRATVSSSNSPVWLTPCDVPSRCSAKWSTAMPPCRRPGGSNFAWASMSATSSSKRATSLAMASTSPRAWRHWPSRAGSACQCRGARAGARQARYLV